ncbi:MAG: metal ABC transporter substrate-binding protein [Ilumatobacteraceae bacterium]
MKRLLGVLFSIVILGSCTQPPTSSPDNDVRPEIVVTYSVLGTLVSELVGDIARVTVIIPDGQDPHDFEPSAKDIEAINDAQLLVSNGLEFEEGLVEPLNSAANRGVEHFVVTDHLTSRTGGDHSHAEDDGSHSSAIDPHVWLSPYAMSEMIDDLALAVGDTLGIDVTAQSTALMEKLAALDSLVTDRIESLDACVLVTGHDELGYFADRYGCTVVGAVIPSFSTTAEASAGELADLKELVRKYTVPAIFTGIGTSSDVVEVLSTELGIPAIELATHYLSGVTTYEAFITRLVDQIVGGLS